MLKPTIHVLAVAAILVTAACAAPEYNYVKNSGQKTYFKVPHDWQQTGTDSLDDELTGTPADSARAAARKQAWWSVAYDAASTPDAQHLISGGVTAQPIVYARIAPFTKTQQNRISLDVLRNIIWPVTDDAREAYAADLGLSGFELLRDDVLAPGNGVRGVRVVFDYVFPSGVVHTFDETALVNNDNSKMYLLMIRCTTACYKARFDELNAIATSFTVRSH